MATDLDATAKKLKDVSMVTDAVVAETRLHVDIRRMY